jgi:uncharacterized protein (TIGR02147 family)
MRIASNPTAAQTVDAQSTPSFRLEMPPRLDVFDYLDYRAFLRDYYLEGKACRGLSYRALSRRVGLKSSNFFKLVLDGSRNLSQETAGRFAQTLGLEDDAHRYFLELVRMNQARSPEARDEAHARLVGYRRCRRTRLLEARQATYHSTWYLPAIRELVVSRSFRDDPAWIARTLQPSITASEAAQALDTLLALGLLVRDAAGALHQGEALLSTGPETSSRHVATYHRAMMQLATSALDRIPAVQRDISALTLCLGRDGLRRVKQRIQRFRRELLELSATEERLDQVVQVNFQLFPLSKAGEDGPR